MRLALVLACALAASGVRASAGGHSAPQTQAEFDALLKRVKQSDPSVDFLQLRRLFADSSSFVPFADDAEESMLAAEEGRQYETALKIAREILSRDYLNIEAHFTGAVSCRSLGDATCHAHHVYVARGMFESIMNSGDGKTPATAFMVVRVPEEYALLRMLDVQEQGQSLVRSDDGHSYDVFTVRDPSTNVDSRIYFNVDIVLASMSRVLGRR